MPTIRAINRDFGMGGDTGPMGDWLLIRNKIQRCVKKARNFNKRGVKWLSRPVLGQKFAKYVLILNDIMDYHINAQKYFELWGGHSGLLCDTSWKLGCLYPMPHYAIGCRISSLIMVPINFWRNSDLFKKKKVFLAQILTEIEHFKENL